MLDRVENTKFLGVYIDHLLNWKSHITQISLKIFKSIGVINRLKKCLPSKSLINLYFTMIHPYLLYCNMIWGSATQLALHKIVILQKRGLRIITNSNFRSPSSPLFKMLNILRLQDIYIFQCAQFMYKAKNNLLPVLCQHRVTVVKGFNGMNLDIYGNLKSNITKQIFGKNVFQYLFQLYGNLFHML